MTGKLFIGDVGEPEGPAFSPDGSFYLTEMAIGRSCVSRIESGVRRVVLPTAGRPNGLAFDGDGDLWVAEAREGAVLRADRNGTVKQRIAGDATGRFLWPNDLAFGPDGMLYLTDSGILDLDLIPDTAIRADFAKLKYDGRLYRIDPVKRQVDMLDRGFLFTNGIAFGPDQQLYINEMLTGDVFRYDLQKARPQRELHGNVLIDRSGRSFGGPDGMKFDVAGNLYCAVFGQSDITVLDPTGKVAKRLKTKGAKPTNVAFAPSEPRIFITEVETSSVYTFDVPHVGQPLFAPRIRG